MVSKDDRRITSFLTRLMNYRSEAVFNPWSENCEHSDSAQSYVIRSANLRHVLEACVSADSVDIWIGRDLGWRGGRRTGIPLVDELTLDAYGFSIAVHCLSKATVDGIMKERTATEIHVARERIPKRIFFWNVFPFHPHEKGKARSNRMHTREERNLGLEMLESVLDLLPVRDVVAIGNDAGKAIEGLGRESCVVRHPSYGGQREFHAQIAALYNLQTLANPQWDLFEARA